MKLSAIKSLCMREDKIVLYTESNGKVTWIGTDETMYPTEGVMIDENSIINLFDLSDKKAEKVKIETVFLSAGNLTPYVGMDDALIQTEESRMNSWVAVYQNGSLHRALSFGGKLYMVDVNKLKPAIGDDDYLQFYFTRNSAGNPLIAVMDGLILSGIVWPDPSYLVQGVKKLLGQMNFLGCGEVLQISVKQNTGEAETEQMSMEGTEDGEDD